MNFSIYEQSQKNDIIALYLATFSASESKQEGEQVARLVTDFLAEPYPSTDLYVFVATDEQRIVGAIVMSRLQFAHAKEVFLLSPVAVATNWQGQGIGQKLIQFGCDKLAEQNVSLVMTYGDINFYGKVGFSVVSEEIIQAPHSLSYPKGWLAKPVLDDEILTITGKPSCLKPLDNPQLW